MANEHEMNQAEIAFDTLCEMLDNNGWTYTKDSENLAVYSGATGDDLPIDIRIVIDPDKQLISLFSELTFIVPEDDRIALAAAICAANYTMVDGCFDYNVFTGKIIFRMTSSIRNSIISKDLFEYMLYVSCATVDNYNDKLFMLTKHAISLEDFINVTKE